MKLMDTKFPDKELKARVIHRMGYDGDPERLQQAITKARKEVCEDCPSTQVVCEPTEALKLCAAVRRELKEWIEDCVILRVMLLWMPRTCSICHELDEGLEYCDECDGCSLCCTHEEHCETCGFSINDCTCPWAGGPVG